MSFFKQFYHSITESDYIVLRQGFIMVKLPSQGRYHLMLYLFGCSGVFVVSLNSRRHISPASPNTIFTNIWCRQLKKILKKLLASGNQSYEAFASEWWKLEAKVEKLSIFSQLVPLAFCSHLFTAKCARYYAMKVSSNNFSVNQDCFFVSECLKVNWMCVDLNAGWHTYFWMAFLPLIVRECLFWSTLRD